MPTLSLSDVQKKISAGERSVELCRIVAGPKSDAAILQNLDMQGRSLTFDKCWFDTDLDLRDGRFGSLVFRDCVFSQKTEWNQDAGFSLDLGNAVLERLTVDLIPKKTTVPEGKSLELACLTVNLDRATISRSAQLQVSNTFGGLSGWLGREPGRLPDPSIATDWGGQLPEEAVNPDEKPVLIVSAYQARIEHDLGLQVTCDEMSANRLRAVSLLAPDIDVMGSLSIIGSPGGSRKDARFLPISCNLELAQIRDQVHLSGVQLGFRDGADQSKSLPALSLVGARIGSLLLDDIALHDATDGLVAVPDKKTQAMPARPVLPFVSTRFNVTGQGVLAKLRLDRAVVQFNAPDPEPDKRPDYAAIKARMWEELARHDSEIFGERALVTLHDALRDGGAHTTPDVLKEHLQKNRRRRDFNRHWGKDPSVFRRSLIAVAGAALATLVLNHPDVPSHIWGWPVYGMVGLAVMGIAACFGLWRAVKPGDPNRTRLPVEAVAVGLAIVAAAATLASFVPYTGGWSLWNAVLTYLFLPILLLFLLTRRGRHMVMQAVESFGQSWMTRIVSDGKRPLTVLSVLLVVWAGLSIMYFTAANRGFMAPEEIETFHLEPWYAQTDALRLRLDDCAGGKCGPAKGAAEAHEAADAAQIAAIYLKGAARPDPNEPSGLATSEADLQLLARIPGFAYFSACRINWVGIGAGHEADWVAKVVELSGLDGQAGGPAPGDAAAAVEKLDPAKICAWFLPAEYSAFQPFLYAADVVIPLLNLRQEEEWSIRVVDPFSGAALGEAHVFLVAEALATLIGWLCVLNLVSELTGLTNPSRRFR